MPSALQLFALAAEQGNADAMFNLGCHLSNQIPRSTDARSSSVGSKRSNDSSTKSESTSNWTTAELETAAVELWQRAAAQGHAGAHFNCGVALANHASSVRSVRSGHGSVRSSSSRIRSRDSSSTSNSSRRAFEHLSPGIAMVQAAAHYAAAADAGHAGAAFNLGCLHEVCQN